MLTSPSQGFSYSLNVLIPPFSLITYSTNSSSKALTSLERTSINHLRILGSVSSISFLSAYFYSPLAQKHPYLLWSTLCVGSSFLVDLFPASIGSISSLPILVKGYIHEGNGSKSNQQLEASYEDLSRMDHSDGELEEEDVNREKLRAQLKTYTVAERTRVSIIGIGLAMSVVGIWGDRFNNLITGAP